MGVWGWDEIQDGVTLFGFSDADVSLDADDMDWNIDVWPGSRSHNLLTNPNNFTNTPPMVQCEVQPPPVWQLIQGSDDGDQEKAMEDFAKSYLDRVKNRHVAIVGTWARDRSHYYNGGSIGVDGDGNKGKTEIHPVAGVLIEHPPTASNTTRQIEFIVLADFGTPRQTVGPPGWEGATPPHSGDNQNRVAKFKLAVAASSTLKVVAQVDYGRSHSFAIVPDGATGAALEADIESGTIRDQQGFYNGVVELTPGYTVRPFLKSRGFDPSKGVLKPMTQSGVKSIRAMFGVAKLEA